MLVRLIKSYRYVVAVCDSELLGKRFEEGDFQLHVKESFYKGEEKSEKETVKFLERMAKEDATFNIVGEKSVSAALKAGIINEDSVGEVQGIKFALVLL
ncbi:MAG TPA: DUF424 family protein [Candidatus Omnitrophota bacterium]|nr:DUF424 family protein [Candidatus Omnitrophota bacterium]